jgi:molecular chaperone DnaK
VEIHVMQGERPLARDNRTLGKFHLIGIPPAPRGVPQVEVTFDIDANGILNVSAKDMATKKEQKITITSSTGLSKEEAERMRHDAESHAEEDKKHLAEIEARNQCDMRVYQAEKLLKENREKVSESDAKSVEEAIEACRKALAGTDVEAITAASAQLETATHTIAEAMYKATAASAGHGPASSGAASDGGSQSSSDGNKPPQNPGQGEVIDAEFVDVDNTKKPN